MFDVQFFINPSLEVAIKDSKSQMRSSCAPIRQELRAGGKSAILFYKLWTQNPKISIKLEKEH